ncbi:MAG: response regulator transcription factor [Thermoleophilaceae bacterium]|nr:response regulator transcription factor [Thermoleophilaceae bacterium]
MRVTIVEDLALLRDGLARLLEDNGCKVVAAVDNVPDFLAALESELPDVAICDVRLPPNFNDEGVRAAIEARGRWKGLPVLILSQYVEQTYASELLADGDGGVGYLLKDRVAKVGDFVDAVRRVAAGGMALDPEAVSQLMSPARAVDGPFAELTERERDVLDLMAQGRSNKGIAGELFVTEGAVEKHISKIFDKLDLPPSGEDHRRVLAVIDYLRHSG